MSLMLMGNCRSQMIEVIPDRETMMEIVETIVEFEDMLKKGQAPTRAQKREIKRVRGIANEMKRLRRVQSE